MLQQLSAITTPFVRQQITFALIAMGTSNHEIIGTIRSTAIKWNNMIDVISFANCFAAPIAFTLLGFILALYIGGSMVTPGSPLSSAVTAAIGAMCFWVFLVPFVLLLPIVFGTFGDGIPNGSPCLLRIGYAPLYCSGIAAFFIALMKFSIDFTVALLVGIFPFLGAQSMTSSAFGMKAIAQLFVARKVFRRCEFVLLTGGTVFEWIRQVKHSVSLSLNLRWVSADGEIIRRSGISLADKSIIPHNLSTCRLNSLERV